MSLEVGSTVGGYQVVEAIGEGGVGRVFKVRHNITGRTEAMKILLSDHAEEDEQVSRFLREIKIQATLNHPNIATVLNAIHVGKNLVMIMEFVEGESLDKTMERGRIALDVALDYIAQALSAVGYAHEHGVIHRDIKPENILLTRQGVIKVADFGCARTAADPKLTGTGAVLGSLFYMSPEQVKGLSNIDERADIYSIGAVLYEIVSGRKPFLGDQPFQLMTAHVSEEPRPPIEIDPEIPRHLNDAILKALSKDPEERFETAEDFRDAIESPGFGRVRWNETASSSAVPTADEAVESSVSAKEEAKQKGVKAGAKLGPPLSVSLFVFFFFFFFIFFYLYYSD